MICFRDSAWRDYLDWQQTDRKIVQRINLLIKDIQRHPFEGIGKPEPRGGRYRWQASNSQFETKLFFIISSLFFVDGKPHSVRA